MKRKDTRPLTVNGEEWEYKIGKKCVAIYNPKGDRYFPRFEDINSDRGSYYNKSLALNPAMILDYILTKILGDKPQHHMCVSCLIVKSDVSLRNNPFEVEIHDDYSVHYLCDNCVNGLMDEI